jgi:putative glycosyltransferase (TIGR04372 family)
MLQPRSLVKLEEVKWPRVHKGQFLIPPLTLPLPKNLIQSRDLVFEELNLLSKRLVALAVHTRTYDQIRNKNYALKGLNKETVGSELVLGVDVLEKRDVKLVLLGSTDVGTTHVPRTFPRLADFGTLGGPHEVVIASKIDFFWSDGVGAWWLSFPFKRPVLYSNQLTLRIPAWMWPEIHLVVPVRYQYLDGTEVTIREELSSQTPLASRSDVHWIRNSPEEIAEAIEEMLALIEGTWEEPSEVSIERKRFERMFDDFPQYKACRVSASFLKRYSYLIS